jgi:hypothetical protein
LGISYEAARSRLRRQRATGTAPRRSGRSVASGQRDRPADRPAATATGTDRTAADLLAQLRADVAYLQAALEQEHAAQTELRATLERELERAAVERAELRRLLAAEQQRRLLAPVETVATQPQAAENAAVSAEPRSTSARAWWQFWRR